MAGCYRCALVMSRNGQGVGVCLLCGAMACRLDGERDRQAADFVCGMCQPSRIATSGGFPPPRPPPGPRGGPGGPRTPVREPEPPDSGGGGALAFTSSADFERRSPVVAEQSAEHRRVWRGNIRDVVRELEDLRHNERAQALAEVSAEELDPRGLANLAMFVGERLHDARQRGRLDEELLADAFGVASWAIGVEPGQEPDFHQLSHLSDERLQLVVGRFTPRPEYV